MSDPSAERRPPPYASYKSLRNFLERMREVTLPSRIDKSIVSNLNYGTQAALLAALKSLALITSEGQPLPRLELLAHGNQADEGWRLELRAALSEAYPYIFNSSIDLRRASSAEIDEAFKRAADIKGSTVDKVVSFFLAAATDAGIELSPHLVKRKPVGGSGPKRMRAKPRVVRKEEPDVQQPPPPTSAGSDLVTRLVGKFPEFDPSWPDEIKAKWFEGFDRLMGSVAPTKSG